MRKAYRTAAALAGALCLGNVGTVDRRIVQDLKPVDLARTPAPLTDPSSWVTVDDYPVKALDDVVEGVTTTSLTVDASGFVSACRVAGSSGSPLLDQTACTLLTARARFRPSSPALGGGFYTQRVRWQIPRPPAIELRATRFTVQYDVDEAGRPTDCVAQGEVPNGVPIDQICAQLQRTVTFKVQPNAAGEAVRRRVVQTFSTEVTELPRAANKAGEPNRSQQMETRSSKPG